MQVLPHDPVPCMPCRHALKPLITSSHRSRHASYWGQHVKRSSRLEGHLHMHMCHALTGSPIPRPT